MIVVKIWEFSYKIGLRKSILISSVFLLASCVSKKAVKHVDTYYRFSDIQETPIHVTPSVVDLCIDFDAIVTGKSPNCLTEQEAIEGAQFDALIHGKDSNLAVLVSPIYFVEREEQIRGRKSKLTYRAEVLAFSGKYCGQYSMIEAMEKVKPISEGVFLKEALMSGKGAANFGIANVLVSEVFVMQPKQVGGLDDANIIGEPESLESKGSDNKGQVSLKEKLEGANLESEKNGEKAELGKTSADSVLVDTGGKRDENNTANPQKGDVLPYDSLGSWSGGYNAREMSGAKDRAERDSVQWTNDGRIKLDEHFKQQYYQDIVRDSAQGLIERGKDQIEFVLHNDDYISRWMRENESLKMQLIMFKKIMIAEASYIDIKYKKERTPDDDRLLGALDLELLEYEYLNRKKLLFYSNFNFQRAKKLIFDCYQTCHDTLKPVVEKYIELADFMLDNDRKPMQINSTDPLILQGLPLRRKLNAEYFAAELYIRGWEICSGIKKTFGEYSMSSLFEPDSSQLALFQSQEQIRMNGGDERSYRLKGLNSQRFFQKKFPKGSFNDLLQYAANLPDTLTQTVFKTFSNPFIDEDAVFPDSIHYPSGLIYVIQVGAFRREIPVSFYKSFAPVVKEYKSEGVYRYTAGFFPKYNSAVLALKQIKKLGYKDAFIVAMMDGKRVDVPKSIKLK